MRPSEFWALTHAEFFDMHDYYVKSLRRDRNRLVFTAWHVAALERQKTLPSLDSVLVDEDPTVEVKQQSVEDMMGVVRMINAAWGGEEVET